MGWIILRNEENKKTSAENRAQTMCAHNILFDN